MVDGADRAAKKIPGKLSMSTAGVKESKSWWLRVSKKVMGRVHHMYLGAAVLSRLTKRHAAETGYATHITLLHRAQEIFLAQTYFIGDVILHFYRSIEVK